MSNLFGEEEKAKKETEKKTKTKSKGEEESYEPESFEAAMAELEKLVLSLESGEPALEESIGIYKKARVIASWCYKKLTEVQGELKKLGVDEQGNFTLDDLPPVE
ncbi:exodeoxyribonuclease VII small subunit [bacterium]|nr:MAG: exodeoxyribonuclease VII small subunit [bacterium]